MTPEDRKLAEKVAEAILADGEVQSVKVMFTAPCGHNVSDSKYAGTIFWQNCWTCQICGRKWSR